MTIDEFWHLIDKGKDSKEPEEMVADELNELSLEDLISYQKHFEDLSARAYQWKLWGAAYIICGGCSDDGFMDFRFGLISKGREIFEAAVKNPDYLAELDLDDSIQNELFGGLALNAYEDKSGNEMPEDDRESEGLDMGERWDFDDRSQNLIRLPKLSQKYL